MTSFESWQETDERLSSAMRRGTFEGEKGKISNGSGGGW